MCVYTDLSSSNNLPERSDGKEKEEETVFERRRRMDGLARGDEMEKTEQREEKMKDTMKGNMKGEILGRTKRIDGGWGGGGTYLASASL